jgi:hypothetical protein
MTFVRANPASWALFELLTSTQMNLIDENLSNALDGLDGGDYALSDQLQLDGSGIAGAGLNTLKLINSQLGSSVYIEVSSGSGVGLEIVQPGDTEVDNQMMTVTGASLAYGTGAPATVFIATGHSNSLEDGGAAIKAFGGATTFAGGFGGRGLEGVGGAGDFGGYGVDAEAGASDFTGMVGYTIGRAAVHSYGGTLIGDDALHYASPGARLVGGDTSGTGLGGPGAVLICGVGPTGLLSGVDAGPGSVSRGSSGILASTVSVDPLNLPSEFATYNDRAAGNFFGKTYGSGISSLFSGTTTHTYYNQLGVIGAGTSIGGKTLLRVFTDTTSTPSSQVVGIELDDYSGLTNFVFQPITAVGGGAPILTGSLRTRDGVDPPHINFTKSFNLPGDEYVDGGLVYLNAGEVTGLLDSCYFIGSDGRAAYDRVVTSGDRAALQAWGIARLDGLGGIVNGSNYGINTCAFGTDAGGEPCVRFTLDTITGQPVATSMIAFGSWTATSGYAVNAYVEDATHITVTAQDVSTGTFIDFSTFPFAIDVNCMVIGTPAIGTSADRPTYYVP